jgi:predicted nuclease with TOPRIM domain
MTEIIVALITGGLSLLGVVITCLITNRKTKEDIKEEFRVAQAVTDTKIEELTREVREHNNFAKRMPVVENEIKHIENDIHNLQKYHQN